LKLREDGMVSNLGISQDARTRSVQALRVLLADEYVLYTKTRTCHWDVVGGDFSQLHELFEEQYEELNKVIDAVAERSRMLGSTTQASLSGLLGITRLEEEASGEQRAASEMIWLLLQDHEALVSHLRADIQELDAQGEDFGTVDFLIGVMKEHEKQAWMLRAHLQEK